MDKPILLDTYCKAGGCTKGYQRAGFYVVGVDIEPQKNYCGDEFFQGDAIEFIRKHGREFDVISASPPCQPYSKTKSMNNGRHSRLVRPTRQVMKAAGRPYIIENVLGAPLVNPIVLCGSAFGLGVRRHRLFETSPLLLFRPYCYHHLQPNPIDVTGTGGWCSRHHKPRSINEAREAMGIDWMIRSELNQAIPPAYTEWIGEQMIGLLSLTKG